MHWVYFLYIFSHEIRAGKHDDHDHAAAAAAAAAAADDDDDNYK